MSSVLVFVAVCAAQPFPQPQPMSPQNFAVMPWSNAPSDPELLRGMKEAGLNIAGFCRADNVESVRAAGLTCILRDPRAGGYNWQNLPAEDQIRKSIAELKQQFGSNPAVLGFYLSDEPRTPVMPAIGRVSALLREAMPDKLPYVNLFPYRGGMNLGWYTDYTTYVRNLVEVIRQPFISFDNYSLSYGQMHDDFFNNLEVVRRVGLETKTPFWSCVLSTAHFGYMEPSNATFNLQAYCTMAYGGRGIQYFTYFTPERGNYRMGPIDQFGIKTPTWDAMRRINFQIHALAPTLIKLRSTGVYHYPDAPVEGKRLAASSLVDWIGMEKDEDHFERPSVAARFLVGEFQDEQGRAWLMIVNKDLVYSFRFDMHFKRPVKTITRINPYSGREERFGGEANWLQPGGGVLLRVE